MKLSDEISCLKGVGGARLEKLNSLGIFTLGDLITYYPRDYIDRSKITPVFDVIPERINTIRGYISETPRLSYIGGLRLVRAKIRDESGEIEAVWFNQPYLKNYFKKDIEYFFTGPVSERLGKLQITNPDFEAFGPESVNYGRIIPIYALTRGVTQTLLRKLINSALICVSGELEEFLPDDIITAQGLSGRLYSVKNIHFPETNEAFYAARQRLVFEELFILQLALFKLKSVVREKTSVKINDISYEKITEKLPFDLTNAQKRVLNDITGDFISGYAAARLVQGDVGSGKTAVAAIASFIVIKNGYQAVLMAPTEVLARQHFEYFQNLFGAEIKIVFLSGSVSASDKKKIYSEVRTGFAKMLIGTHALIEETVEFKNLGLAITDEQHRFGVRQRMRLGAKGASPHILVMTATPIPRTLALTLYGDLDLSVIDELPPSRQIIDTFLVNSSMRERVYAFIKKEISSGRQSYIICPSIEESEQKELLSAAAAYRNLSGIFSGFRTALLHGRMSGPEKDEIMRGFSGGEIQALVSTTVIEVGVNVPNATVMLVENAERFGLSQLHQLRGRVGRGRHKSYCILLSDSKTKNTKERLEIMTRTNDGFKISETDLKLRGAGDFFGTRQSGLAELRIANIYEDLPLLESARTEAARFLESGWEFSEYPLIAEEVDLFFKKSSKISL